MASCDFAVIGMAVMGRNLAMNAASKGFQVAVYNRTTERAESAVQEAKEQGVTLHLYKDVKDLAAALSKPRRVLMMVQAGRAVDSTLDLLLTALEPGDIVVDGGNEFYANTDRRVAIAKDRGVHYMGMGVSGGEEGARHGPSLMPGGDREAYEAMKPILEKIAANVDGRACVEHMGLNSAGNYVKMVHNGIEYGDMQLISETYDFMRKIMKMDNDTMAITFKKWNDGFLKSYLIEITSEILAVKQDGTGKHVVDVILSQASGKGTGKWTCQEASEKHIPIPTIQAALDARYLSTLDIRKQVHNRSGQMDSTQSFQSDVTVDDLAAALHCSKICSYAQGFSLLREASKEHGFEIPLSKVPAIWVGGCIIRAEFLKDIVGAFERDPDLSSLLLDRFFAEQLTRHGGAWRKVVIAAQKAGVPVPAYSASLNYYDALRAESLPANLVQAQRDFFGAHTFKRIDKDGVFHANWKTGHISTVQQ